MADPHYLHTVSMTELYQTDLLREQTADYRRPALRRGVYPRRCAEDRQILLGSADSLSCQHRQEALGLRCASRYGAVPRSGGRLPKNPKPYVYDVWRGGQREAPLRNGGKQDRKRA